MKAFPKAYKNQDRRFVVRRHSGEIQIRDEDTMDIVAKVESFGPEPKADAVLFAHAPVLHLLAKQAQEMLFRIQQEIGFEGADPLGHAVEALDRRLVDVLSDIEVQSHG